MSDWQVGDLAVCVDAKPRGTPPDEDFRNLREGASYRVLEVVFRGMGLVVAGANARFRRMVGRPLPQNPP